jgi:hypothetical protein
MLSQAFEPPPPVDLEDATTSDGFDIRMIPTPPLYLHIITLINRQTSEEVSFEVETTSIRFKDVLDAIIWQKVERNLFGYEIFAVIDCNDPC